MNEKYNVYLVSDSTGETLDRIFLSLKSQFANFEYEKKFSFPFIMAVKGKDKIEILNNFRQRINNNIEFEFEESKKQVKKIALFRLEELFTK